MGDTRAGPPVEAPYWRKLDGTGMRTSTVGGKAAMLDRLVAAGVSVPTAAALTIHAYRLFISTAGLEGFISGLPERPRPDRLERDEERVRAAFATAPLDPVLRAAIRSAFEYVEADCGVAVRSSATAEDLEDASFAGQYRTVLDVGPAQIEDAVRLCWASLWFPAARTYRAAVTRFSSLPDMGVIIQRMVSPIQSGVLFSVDPTSTDTNVLRVEVVDGPGEGLVSGRVTPRVFRFDRTSGRLMSGQDPPTYLEELVAVARSIESLIDRPQDIEWSATADGLSILQTRPVTASAASMGDDFDTVVDADTTFTSAGIVEMLPGTLSPLVWTINGPLLESAFTDLFARLGIDVGTGGPIVGRFRGRAALNLTKLRDAARAIPGGSAEDVEIQYVGRVISDEPEPGRKFGDRLKRFGPALRSLALRRQLDEEADAFVAAVGMVRELGIDLTHLDAHEIADHRRAVRELAQFGFSTEVAVAAAAAGAYQTLEDTLAKAIDTRRALPLAQAITAGATGGPVGGVMSVLNTLDDDDRILLWELVQGGPIQEIDQRMSSGDEKSLELAERVSSALALSGSMSVYGGPTWEEDRDVLWAVVRQYLRSAFDPRSGWQRTDPDEARDRVLEMLSGTGRWRTLRILTGQVIDVRKRMLERLMIEATEFLRLREEVKAALLDLGGFERRAVVALVERLGAEFGLNDEDAWMLTDDELDGAARGKPLPTAAELKRRRTVFEALRLSPELPETFTGQPPMDALRAAGGDTFVLSGWAAAPGTVAGPAQLVDGVADATEVDPGEIIVGHSSDSSWTPLFLTAAGIVLEEGGPLSHAAVVARELGLPAVLNVKDATRIITTGTRLVVDGTKGTVQIADDEGES